MVALPVLAGALLRVVFGILVDRLRPKRAGIIGQLIVIAGLTAAWLFGVKTYQGALLVGLVLGVAGASFAVRLPLASRWYPPQYQGIALGIAGAGNSGTVLASLFAPGLAALVGWNNVLGLACCRSRSLSSSTCLPPRTAPTRRRPRNSTSTSPCSAWATPGGSCSSTP
jgi:NNP family nitrate/nitrite transporter-like MFS transporter